MKHSKRYRAASEKLETDKIYEVREAIELLKSFPSGKFDETVEVCLKLSIDPKQSDQIVRGAVALPHGTGKKVRVVAFCTPEEVEEVTKAGAIMAGTGAR